MHGAVGQIDPVPPEIGWKKTDGQTENLINPILHGLLGIRYHMEGIKTIPPYENPSK